MDLRPARASTAVAWAAISRGRPPRSTTSNFASALRTRPLKLLGQGKPFRFRGNNAAVTGLMEMQIDRFREVAGINRHSDTADPLATGSQEVAALIDACCKAADDGLKISAAQRLAIFRDPAAAPALAAELDHPVARGPRGRGHGPGRLRHARIGRTAPGGAGRSPIRWWPRPRPSPWRTSPATPNRWTPSPPPAARSRRSRAWRDWFHGTTWDAIEQDLVARLESPDRDVVRRAAVALGHVGGDAARAALRQYVARHRDDNPYPEWMTGPSRRRRPLQRRLAGQSADVAGGDPGLGLSARHAGRAAAGRDDRRNSDPPASNLFLAEACAEALGRIGTPEAEAALIQAHTGLKDYFYYVGWYGDHSALYACHASPVHYFIAESLDMLGVDRAGPILPHLIRSVPTDPDRALLPMQRRLRDDRRPGHPPQRGRSGRRRDVPGHARRSAGQAGQARSQEAISTTYQAWGGKPDPENRAAQILSAVCRDRQYEPRIRAALDRYRQKPAGDLVRAFAGGGLPHALPIKHWVCFFLARTLGNLGDPHSVDSLCWPCCEQCPSEAAPGRPDPTSAGGPVPAQRTDALLPGGRGLGVGPYRRSPGRRRAAESAARRRQAPPTRTIAAAEALERLAMRRIRRISAGQRVSRGLDPQSALADQR